MSNLANYSPYNKSYKFILFQNQAYHSKNKINASPCVRTNLRHSMSRYSPTKNPELVGQANQQSYQDLSDAKRCQSPSTQMTRSLLFKIKKQIESPIIDKPKRIVHKNLSFEKFREQRISQENIELTSRLINTSCEVIKNKKAEKSFQKHREYKNIRMKYMENGPRKDSMPLGNTSYLCPTLLEFNRSGLAERFIEEDLALTVKPSTARSIRRSYLSQFDN